MNLTIRVSRLERTGQQAGGCAYCRGGDGRWSVVVLDGEQLGPPGERCGACAERAEIRRIVISNCAPEDARVLKHLAGGPVAA